METRFSSIKVVPSRGGRFSDLWWTY